jgi:hypothetical protein
VNELVRGMITLDKVYARLLAAGLLLQNSCASVTVAYLRYPPPRKIIGEILR